MINASQFETYKKLGVTKLEYLTGGVDRTCPKCKEYIYTRGYNFDYREKVPKTRWKEGNYVCVKKH